MLTIDEFKDLIKSKDTLSLDIDKNDAQRTSLKHDGEDALLIVAGPGSGKTTVLVLRALRHVLVDGIFPENILMTTFTRKAAKVLRTRWLDWGTLLISKLRENPEYHENLSKIDLNRCRIDTLDSVIQQALTDYRLHGEIAPIVIDKAPSKIILKRSAFSESYRNNKDSYNKLLSRYTFKNDEPRNNGEALTIMKTLSDRLIQDCVSLSSYSSVDKTHAIIVDVIKKYKDELSKIGVYDFPNLGEIALSRLSDGVLNDWSDSISAILIDEYQDTNPLQEKIYFEIIKLASPFVTVVGDDDQSMYRFRGGSVELFTQFSKRCISETGKKTTRVDMVTNYRSSDEIVGFYNSHMLADAKFSDARIIPPKPEVISDRGMIEMPVIGMFRENHEELASSLSEWLGELFESRKLEIDSDGEKFTIELQDDGDLGDCVLLSHSVEEIKYDTYKKTSKIKFPSILRDRMAERGMEVFNPRGNVLRNIPNVSRLLGLVLLCLDPNGDFTNAVYPTDEARFYLNEWLSEANNYIATNPMPSDSGGIHAFIEKWQNVSTGVKDKDFPKDWPALELIFKLITWIPDFQSDPEHQVWLEVIARTVATSTLASPYGMQIYQDENKNLRVLSRQSFIRDAMLPIAENEVEVDEDIMPSIPRNRLQFMTIHQSKGLEFPLVIVDVGSHFTRNNHLQAFLRYPNKVSNVVTMEDDVEPHLKSQLRGGRSPIDRTFDDLVRLYYVAYSRPQSVLLLVGAENCLKYGKLNSIKDGAIPNVALGWDREGNWHWRQPYATRRPPIRVEPPVVLI